ncbi:ABC transporter permease [Streptomyces sp. NPDC099088]|uniref:ABC transporter permease n=1 Tax=Streptomyces sp. NPDC099088 TaxID=3366101 RepID=UPI00380DF187
MALCIVAETTCRLLVHSIPAPTDVLRAAVHLNSTGELGAAMWSTARSSSTGLALAVTFAVPTGLVMGTVQPVADATRHLVELMRPVPSVALVPLLMLLASSMQQVHLIAAAYASYWPMLLATIYGVQQVDPVRVQTARAFGAGRLASAIRVMLPSAAPGILTGIRTAVAVSVVVTVGSEVVTGGDGIGGLALTAAQAAGATDIVLACAMAAAVLGLTGDLVARGIGRTVCGWNHQRLAGPS